MSALTKSFDRCSSVANTAYTQALQLKSAGILNRMNSNAMISGPSDWMGQTKSRENYSYFRSWVYAAINALASKAASQQVNVGILHGSEAKEDNEEDAKYMRRTKEFQVKTMTSSLRKKAADKELEVIQDHELMEVLEKPNSMQDRFQFVYSYVANLNLTGRAYIVKDEEDGKTVYYSLPTTWVRPDHTKGPFKQFYIANPRDLDFTSKMEPLDASQVAMTYFPNPSNPMGAIGPASAMSPAIRVDDRIQTCQEKFFDNGIFPSVIVTVGKDPHPDADREGVRPRLTGEQRRQVMGAIRRVMGGVANFGNPAIVDGLIENITRLSATQNELGWEKSEDKLKARILSAFCVHPFMLGEMASIGGYAQSAVIERIFCDRVNIFLDLISALMTRFVRGSDEGEKLLIWWEKATAYDPQMEWSNLKAARANGDISQNELRAKLGFPPDKDRNEAVISATQVPAISTLLSFPVIYGIPAAQIQAVLEGMGIPTELSQRMCGHSPEAQIEDATDKLNKAVNALKTIDPRQKLIDVVSQL